MRSKDIHVLHIDRVTHTDKNGNILWSAEGIDNMLHDEGEMAILSAYFATGLAGYGAPPANLYFGLDARTTLVEADNLAALVGEVTTTSGYARQAVATTEAGTSGAAFYINQPAAYYRADSKTVTFTASGAAWPAVKNLFLCTVSAGSTGKLISSLALTADRTLQDGDSLNASMYLGLSE